MRHDNNAWFTIFDSKYDNNRYIYHYTSIDTAVKILYNNCIKFSKISSTNDTLESKPKLGLDESLSITEVSKIRNFISNLNAAQLQLLCFTMDRNQNTFISPNDDKQKYGDYTGRGFSLPRMWAQYANNNCGVCFVFKKKKMEKIIKETLDSALIRSDKIKYISCFDAFPLSSEITNKILNKLDGQSGNIWNSIFTYDFLKSNIQFVDYCYFSKLDDWIGENEFRFLAFGDSDYFIPNIADALSGVIVGEKTTNENMEILSYFCYNICELKKITFTYNGCNLINIHNE